MKLYITTVPPNIHDQVKPFMSTCMANNSNVIKAMHRSQISLHVA